MIAKLHCHLSGAARCATVGWMANDTGHARNPRPLNRGDGDALLLGEPAGAEGGRTGSAASREERACEAERLGTNRPFRVRAEQCEGSQLQRSTCNSAAKPRRPNSGGRTLEAVAEQFVPSKKPYFSRLEPLSGVDERKVIDTFQSLVAVQIVPATTPARQRRCSSLFPNQQPARDGPAFLPIETEDELRGVRSKRVVTRDRHGSALLVPGRSLHEMSALGWDPRPLQVRHLLRHGSFTSGQQNHEPADRTKMSHSYALLFRLECSVEGG